MELKVDKISGNKGNLRETEKNKGGKSPQGYCRKINEYVQI